MRKHVYRQPELTDSNVSRLEGYIVTLRMGHALIANFQFQLIQKKCFQIIFIPHQLQKFLEIILLKLQKNTLMS